MCADQKRPTMSRLSHYFEGVAVKRLSAVETDRETSNQHEFNGIRAMADLFGTQKNTMDCQYLYLGEEEEQTIHDSGILTWYDARETNPKRTEYRLYFQNNPVMEQASEGDLLVIGKRPDGTALALIVRQQSTYERQVLWLFGVTGENGKFVLSTIEGDANRELGYAERTILETLGIEVEPTTTDWLELLLEHFGMKFPKTRIFSAFARETLADISSLDNPDIALLAWINHEEMLFRTLERHIVKERIDEGFEDVDSFVKFSLSVHNRRKSRMGFALENHLEQVFRDRNIHYSREKVTENRRKPDFIFPSIVQYHNMAFPASGLTMLGAKSSCKDRWRQVLAEADRIEEKHLFTLEPGISLNQTNEMQSSQLQLVLPEELHQTYTEEQQGWLMNLEEFLQLVDEKQAS